MLVPSLEQIFLNAAQANGIPDLSAVGVRIIHSQDEIRPDRAYLSAEVCLMFQQGGEALDRILIEYATEEQRQSARDSVKCLFALETGHNTSMNTIKPSSPPNWLPPRPRVDG